MSKINQIAVLDIKRVQSYAGIKSFQHKFKFAESKRTLIVYASNGTGKTSLVRAIKDSALGNEDLDESKHDFSNEAPKNDIELLDTSGEQMNQSEAIEVLQDFDPEDDIPKKGVLSSLYVDEDIKARVSPLVKRIEDLEDDLDAHLSSNLEVVTSGSAENKKKRVRQELKEVYEDSNYFYRDIMDAATSAEDTQPLPDDLSYANVFNPNVRTALKKEDIEKHLAEFCQNRKQIIQKSLYHSGEFDHHNAQQAIKSLKGLNFFDPAGHRVVLRNQDSGEYSSYLDDKDWEAEIENDKKSIDDKLKNEYNKVEDAINNTPTSRKILLPIIEEYKDLIHELVNFDAFRKKVIAYHIQSFDKLDDLKIAYSDFEKEVKSIQLEDLGKKLKSAVDVFNERFIDAPFAMKLTTPTKDIINLIIDTPIPTLKFIRREPSSGAECEKDSARQLYDSLSSGEQKAFAILCYIYKIEARCIEQKATLLVMDDIVDSFDYSNKHAFLLYLQDITTDEKFKNFRQIIFTHNFDFFRAVNIVLKDASVECLRAIRSQSGMWIQEYGDEVKVGAMIGGWRKSLCSTQSDQWDVRIRSIVALLPFARNIVEYTHGIKNEAYKDLTSYLHIKDIRGLKEKVTNLLDIYKCIFSFSEDELPWPEKNKDMRVRDLVAEAAASVFAEQEAEKFTTPLNLQAKLILSIDIRLMTEEFIQRELPGEVKYKPYQTEVWTKQYIDSQETNSDYCKTLRRVLLLPSETIHVNSFMYEPIIDIPDKHFIDLYRHVKKL